MNPGSFCGHCGAVTRVGALYCGSCGAPSVAGASAPAAPVAPPTMTGTIGVVSPEAGSSAPRSGFRVPGLATFSRRVTAYVVDVVVGGVVAVAPALLLFAGVRDENRWSGPIAVGLGVVGPLAYAGLLWLMAAYGNSPGNALLGIRVVREATGSRPGAGVGLGRLLLRGLLIAITLGVAGFSPLWDPTGRRRGWWDRGCGTLVLARPAVPDFVVAIAVARPPTLAAMSLGGLPEPGAAGVPASVVGPGPTGFERPAWDIAPVGAPAAPPLRAAPAATWTDRPVDAAPPGPRPRLSASPSTTQSAPPPAGSVNPPWGAVPPVTGVIAAVPGFAIPAEPAADHTRMRVAPEPGVRSTPGWSAVLDDGRVLTLVGPVLLGRDPAVGAGEPAAETVPIADEARSVSKTHLLLDVGPAGVQVTDRHSTNGVTVVTAGVDLPCVPGVATPVPDGSSVRFGERSLVVRRT